MRDLFLRAAESAVGRRSALRAYMAASARASTSAGVSSGPMNATPADAPTTSVEAPQRTGVAVHRRLERRRLRRGFAVSDVPQQHDEFVTADARHDIGSTHMA